MRDLFVPGEIFFGEHASQAWSEHYGVITAIDYTHHRVTVTFIISGQPNEYTFEAGELSTDLLVTLIAGELLGEEVFFTIGQVNNEANAATVYHLLHLACEADKGSQEIRWLCGKQVKQVRWKGIIATEYTTSGWGAYLVSTPFVQATSETIVGAIAMLWRRDRDKIIAAASR